MKTTDMKSFKQVVRKTLREFTLDKDGKPVHSKDSGEKVYNMDAKGNYGKDFHDIHKNNVKGKGFTHVIFNDHKIENVNDSADDAWEKHTGRAKNQAPADH